MGLEGLAAVGAAAAVVQFIGYGIKVVSTTNELYKSTNGALEENEFLESVLIDFKTLLNRIQQSSTPTSQAVQSFRDDGLKLADEMLDGLEKLKAKGLPTKWKSLRKALKSVNSKERVKSWGHRLEALREQFNIHVELDILEKVDLVEVSMSDSFQQLDTEQQLRLRTFMNALHNAQDVFEHTLLQQLDDIRDANRTEHEKTRVVMETSHLKIRNIVQSEHEMTRTAMTNAQQDSYRHTSDQHVETRKHTSAKYDELQSFMSLHEQRVLQESELQSGQLMNVLTASTANLATCTEQIVIEDTRKRIDFLEAELFRTQLENEANIRNEHARSRQALHVHENLRHAALEANALQLRAILHDDLGLVSSGGHAKQRTVASGDLPNGAVGSCPDTGTAQQARDRKWADLASVLCIDEAHPMTRFEQFTAGIGSFCKSSPNDWNELVLQDRLAADMDAAWADPEQPPWPDSIDKSNRCCQTTDTLRRTGAQHHDDAAMEPERILRCSFGFLNCNFASDDLDEWDTHCKSHFRGVPPRKAECPFSCSWSKEAATGDEAWLQRYAHIRDLHGRHGLVDTRKRPSSSMIRHLWSTRIINTSQVKELRTCGRLEPTTLKKAAARTASDDRNHRTSRVAENASPNIETSDITVKQHAMSENVDNGFIEMLVGVEDDRMRCHHPGAWTGDALKLTKSPYPEELSLSNFEDFVSEGQQVTDESKRQAEKALAITTQLANADDPGTTGKPGQRIRCSHPGCAFACARISSLQKHLKCHIPNSQRPHACPQCPQRFLDPRELDRHMTSHRAEMRYLCPFAGCRYAEQGFGRKDHLDRHVQMEHQHGIPSIGTKTVAAHGEGDSQSN